MKKLFVIGLFLLLSALATAEQKIIIIPYQDFWVKVQNPGIFDAESKFEPRLIQDKINEWNAEGWRVISINSPTRGFYSWVFLLERKEERVEK